MKNIPTGAADADGTDGAKTGEQGGFPLKVVYYKDVQRGDIVGRETGVVLNKNDFDEAASNLAEVIRSGKALRDKSGDAAEMMSEGERKYRERIQLGLIADFLINKYGEQVRRAVEPSEDEEVRGFVDLDSWYVETSDPKLLQAFEDARNKAIEDAGCE